MAPIPTPPPKSKPKPKPKPTAVAATPPPNKQLPLDPCPSPCDVSGWWLAGSSEIAGLSTCKARRIKPGDNKLTFSLPAAPQPKNSPSPTNKFPAARPLLLLVPRLFVSLPKKMKMARLVEFPVSGLAAFGHLLGQTRSGLMVTTNLLRKSSTHRPFVSQAEIETHAQPGSLTIYVYYVQSRPRDAKFLSQNDVLTIYGVIASKFSAENSEDNRGLYSVQWFRIVLYEAHTIKSYKSQISIAIIVLAADRRWCLTGTPIQGTVEERIEVAKARKQRMISGALTDQEVRTARIDEL